MQLFQLGILVASHLAALLCGAYGHKWLASVTGAPANLTTANALSAAETAVKDVVKKI